MRSIPKGWWKRELIALWIQDNWETSTSTLDCQLPSFSEEEKWFSWITVIEQLCCMKLNLFSMFDTPKSSHLSSAPDPNTKLLKNWHHLNIWQVPHIQLSSLSPPIPKQKRKSMFFPPRFCVFCHHPLSYWIKKSGNKSWLLPLCDCHDFLELFIAHVWVNTHTYI